jgi:hypothetical protein
MGNEVLSGILGRMLGGWFCGRRPVLFSVAAWVIVPVFSPFLFYFLFPLASDSVQVAQWPSIYIYSGLP